MTHITADSLSFFNSSIVLGRLIIFLFNSTERNPHQKIGTEIVTFIEQFVLETSSIFFTFVNDNNSDE